MSRHRATKYLIQERRTSGLTGRHVWVTVLTVFRESKAQAKAAALQRALHTEHRVVPKSKLNFRGD